MRKSEFKVVPVPARCERAARASGEDPYAQTLELVLNALAVEGWEFYRAETIAMRRGGLFSGRRRRTRDVLVFRRDRPVLAQRPGDIREEMDRLRTGTPLEKPTEAAGQVAGDAAALALPSPRRPRPDLRINLA